MATIATVVDPVARIEGHLKVRLEIDDVTNEITNAELTGNMYRGFENFLVGQLPIDAPLITQRVCGVCPTAHGVASVLAIDDAANVQATPNGIIMRNLIHGAEYLHSHLLHFYHLALQDYINMPEGLSGTELNKGPWAPVYGGAGKDRRIYDDGGAIKIDLDGLIVSYLGALEKRRKAHTVGAIIAGKQPHAASIIPGGCSANLTLTDIANMTTLVTEIRDFIQNTYIPDLSLVFDTYYTDYYSIGTGSGKLLSYGVFRQGTDSTTTMLIKRGIYDGASVVPVMDHNKIIEDISAGWYTGSDNLHPANGETNPDPTKVGGYSWLKAPRYKTDGINKDVYEVGPLARMVVNGSYSANISVADREKARGVEALLVANAMLTWLSDIETNGISEPSYIPCEVPPSSTGVGLTEAIRGALGHWVEYDAQGKIAHYQIITPTCWNSSPEDADSVHGTIEQALIGVIVSDANEPIEAMRIIHSYDPCLACAVHVVKPNGRVKEFMVK